MCGICGIWKSARRGRDDRRIVDGMMEKMRHRGPDDQGWLSHERGVCGHNRLSIMDPEGGKHPICNEDGSLAVIANGEIYNYPQLRRDLERRHRFSTANDSEVLLHLYEERGAAMVEEHAAALRTTLERAVLERLMSDVPVGSFLSGGLDSSIIAAIAARELPELHTFSVGLESSTDREAARIVSGHIGSIHHEHLISEREIFEKLPEIIYYLESFDQDLVRSAIPCYFTSRLASRQVKVILTGEGADELFGGYTYYKDIADNRALNRELRRSVSALHNINLQRVDRLTMAHSIEGRVPFLDLDMIELSQTVEADLNFHGDPPTEKWILRKAFEDLLPEAITWRDKLFNDVYPASEHITGNIGRWAERPQSSPAAAHGLGVSTTRPDGWESAVESPGPSLC